MNPSVDTKNNIHDLDFDAFSHGQMNAKLWLCEKLEDYCKAHLKRPARISIYGSWIGLLPFLILSRGQLQVCQFNLYDVDSESHKTAQKILDYWKFSPEIQIQYFTQDCNTLNVNTDEQDIVINTSCEHMLGLDWWNAIREKTIFCLQSTDMKHPTHISSPSSLENWIESLGLTKDQIAYSGEQFISYPSFSFHRWMLIGKR